MRNCQSKNIRNKYILVCLVFFYVFPLLTNFAHELTHDHVNVCDDDIERHHLHGIVDNDCDLFKFELLKDISLHYLYYNTNFHKVNDTHSFYYYVRTNFVIKSSFLERGPPTLI